MKIIIKQIPHNKQRLSDVGDWQFKKGNLSIKLSDTKDKRHFYLLALHELIEAALCEDRGITEEEVDKWDVSNEKRGDDKAAPYYFEHKFSTKLEKIFAKELDVDWKEYSNTIDSLYDDTD